MKNGDSPVTPYLRPPTDAEKQAAMSDALPDVWEAGLTKREAFAMAAMQGLLSAMGTQQWTPKEVADDAIAFGDVLLTRLEKSS